LINARNHMDALIFLHTEFKEMKALWSQLNKTNYRYSSVEMSKQRFIRGMEMHQLRDIVEPRIRLYGQDVDAGIDTRIVDTCLHIVSD